MARPTKLTSGVAEKIVDAIRAGMFAKTAAGLAGVGERTYYDWLARGREALELKTVPASERPYRDFVEAVMRADVEAEARAVAVVQRAMLSGDYRAALMFLERRYPERWSPRRKVEVEHAAEPMTIRLHFADGKEFEVPRPLPPELA